jgi:cellulose synthase/poly-beta-1,6-N-acetylglucosamine synthase-like glycosyltransferase
MSTDPGHPFVTVVMPVRDEGGFIERSLGAVLAQDWSADRMEVLVADGRSTDGTREAIEALAAKDERVTLVDNVEGIVPTGLNRAIGRAQGEIIVRVDGHAVVPPDYLTRCIALLKASGADCAGGIIDTVGDGPEGRAIAAAQASPFGVGNATFRTGTGAPRSVDTLAFGAYRREVFDRIGLFDEELVRNQDDEFNYRLTQSGGVIWLDPSIVTTYYSRGSLRRAWRQYHQYGLFKVRVIQKRGGVPAARQLVPSAMVLGLGGAAVLSVLRRTPTWFAAAAIPYLAADLAATVKAARHDPAAAPYMVAAFPTFHVSYGTGFLRGLWRYRNRWSESKP